MLTDDRYRSIIFIDYCFLHTPSHHYTPPRYVFLECLSELISRHLLCIRFAFPTRISCNDCSGFVTDSHWDVWYSLWCHSIFWQICNDQSIRSVSLLLGQIYFLTNTYMVYFRNMLFDLKFHHSEQISPLTCICTKRIATYETFANKQTYIYTHPKASKVLHI